MEFEVQQGTNVGLTSGGGVGVQLITKPHESADITGGVIGVTVRVSPDADGDRWVTLGAVVPREFWSTDFLPLSAFGDEPVRRVRVVWHTPHTLGWVGLVEVRNMEYQSLPCLSATHSTGMSIANELHERDGLRATLAPGEFVELVFDASKSPTGAQYVLLAYGRYYGARKEITSAAAPATYSLAQNRPNPFNPETSIAFGLPAPTLVTLRVFNVTGRLIRTLIDKQMPAGFHTSHWNARDAKGSAVSSGVYFYELRAGSFVDRRRMVLLR